MHLRDLAREVNRQALPAQRVHHRRLTHAMSKDSRQVPIGKSGLWSLSVWGKETRTIVEVMEDELISRGLAMSETELFESVVTLRPVSPASVPMLLADRPQVFRRVGMRKWGLTVWSRGGQRHPIEVPGRRKEVERALKNLNIENVDVGLFIAGRVLDTAMKELVAAARQSGAVPVRDGNDRNLNSRIVRSIKHGLINVPGSMHLLRVERNDAQCRSGQALILGRLTQGNSHGHSRWRHRKGWRWAGTWEIQRERGREPPKSWLDAGAILKPPGMTRESDNYSTAAGDSCPYPGLPRSPFRPTSWRRFRVAYADAEHFESRLPARRCTCRTTHFSRL